MIKLIREDFTVSEPFKFPADETWFSRYRDEIDRLIETNDPVLKTYCIVTYGGSQYADGVTGINEWYHAYIDKETQQGWRLKSQARAAANAANIKSFSKKGSGYWGVGSSWNTVEIMSIGDFLKIKKSRPPYETGAKYNASYFEFI
jgi:hypothetical protein